MKSIQVMEGEGSEIYVEEKLRLALEHSYKLVQQAQQTLAAGEIQFGEMRKQYQKELDILKEERAQAMRELNAFKGEIHQYSESIQNFIQMMRQERNRQAETPHPFPIELNHLLGTFLALSKIHILSFEKRSASYGASIVDSERMARELDEQVGHNLLRAHRQLVDKIQGMGIAPDSNLTCYF